MGRGLYGSMQLAIPLSGLMHPQKRIGPAHISSPRSFFDKKSTAVLPFRFPGETNGTGRRVLLFWFFTEHYGTKDRGKMNEVERLLASGKPVVSVLMNGRPLALGWEAEHLPAILEAWHLGIRMGDAVAAVLLGDVNPGGKLSSSFPAVTGQCPVYCSHPSTGRPGSRSKFTSRYLDAPWDALFPFGHGLSYTGFAYDDLRAEETADALEIAVRLNNTGERSGTEVVQLYTQDVAASLVRPVKELKDYRRVELRPGEEREIRFTLPKKDLGFYDNDGQYRLEDGLFRIFVGGSSRETIAQELCLRF